jgi:hypothetical protein
MAHNEEVNAARFSAACHEVGHALVALDLGVPVGGRNRRDFCRGSQAGRKRSMTQYATSLPDERILIAGDKQKRYLGSIGLPQKRSSEIPTTSIHTLVAIVAPTTLF